MNESPLKIRGLPGFQGGKVRQNGAVGGSSPLSRTNRPAPSYSAFLEKLSAMATALSIAFDLLMVSWNSASGAES